MRKYEIGAVPPQIAPALAGKLARVEIATIGHFRHRGFVHRSIAPLLPVRGTLVGTAVTVAIPGTDSTLLHHAIGLLRPGDVLVIDRLGDDRHACLGGGVARAVKRTGAVAVVLDGPCTDPEEIREAGLPVWCRGASAITTRLNDLGGALNLPVACGNVPVLPGDAILADATGVLVLPPGEAEAAADEAIAREARIAERQARAQAGQKLGDLSGASRLVAADQEADHG
ncbi:RraA family protein [Inquilinus sp. NPDC058860]|uniref:RraA family protein n=1 Tax=Inquilinus sp. NPDC058860 TaxID=3346652 RepID=UPI003689A7A0